MRSRAARKRRGCGRDGGAPRRGAARLPDKPSQREERPRNTSAQGLSVEVRCVLTTKRIRHGLRAQAGPPGESGLARYPKLARIGWEIRDLPPDVLCEPSFPQGTGNARGGRAAEQLRGRDEARDGRAARAPGVLQRGLSCAGSLSENLKKREVELRLPVVSH